RLLEPGRNTYEWTTRVPANQVQNGFYYHVTGGDGRTPEHRIQVRSSPLVSHFDVTYTFRPYLRWQPLKTADPNLKAMRGTEVATAAHTTRRVREGRLQIDGEAKPIAAELSAEQPQALKFKLPPLEKDGLYRIWFTSDEGESNTDPLPYKIEVLRDQVPEV